MEKMNYDGFIFGEYNKTTNLSQMKKKLLK